MQMVWCAVGLSAALSCGMRYSLKWHRAAFDCCHVGHSGTCTVWTWAFIWVAKQEHCPELLTVAQGMSPCSLLFHVCNLQIYEVLQCYLDYVKGSSQVFLCSIRPCFWYTYEWIPVDSFGIWSINFFRNNCVVLHDSCYVQQRALCSLGILAVFECAFCVPGLKT